MKLVINTDNLTCILIGKVNEEDWHMVQFLIKGGYDIECAGSVIAEEDEQSKDLENENQYGTKDKY